MKAQKALKKAKKGQGKAPVQTDIERLAAAKARLADMQRMKGKARAVEVEREDSGEESDGREGGTESRSNKHA
jgi:hypothetical protein